MASASVQSGQLANADRVWHLKQAALAAELPAEELHLIGRACFDRIYPKGGVIFREGDPIQHLFILNRGYVQLSLRGTAPRPKVLHILKGGEIFGEELLGPHTHHQSTASAYQDCWVSLLARQRFLNLVQSKPALSLNFIRILTQKLSEARSDLHDQSLLDAQQKVAKTLLKLGDLHGRPILAKQELRKLNIPVSHRRLADLIGGNRPHISTIMSELKKQGVVQYQGRKLLLDMNGLRSRLSRTASPERSAPHPGDIAPARRARIAAEPEMARSDFQKQPHRDDPRYC